MPRAAISRKRLDGSELDGSAHFEKLPFFPELLGLLLELLLELLLLLLYAFYHVLIRGHEAPPYNYVISAYSRSSSRSSSSSSSSSSEFWGPFLGTISGDHFWGASPQILGTISGFLGRSDAQGGTFNVWTSGRPNIRTSERPNIRVSESDRTSERKCLCFLQLQL